MITRSEWSRHGHEVGPGNHFKPFKKVDVEQSIPTRFEQQVNLYPEHIAVKRQKAISYRNLNNSANCIARALLKVRGEKPEPIALFLENGDLIIGAILGVLKSGKAYVPLDPSLPQTRIEFIFTDSQAKCILTNNANFLRASELATGQTQLINIDQLDRTLSADNITLVIPPTAFAYIIYTSGSTGQPKGVVESHRNLLHNVLRNTNTLHLCTDDRVTLLRSIGAAGAARDALSALLNGATVCPFSIKEEGIGKLGGWLANEGITVFTSVITVFRHFAATLSGAERFEKLRLIFAGGEQITSSDIELYQKYFSPNCIFVNRLGITETGTVAYYFINKKTLLSGPNVPVGYDAEDTEILLFDEDQKEVGPDEIGEIAVRSRYISPGYWRRPELNRSVFFSDPAGDKRIYLTGDLGRKSRDGCLSHLGWKNLQVNIRGHRIEVMEVETELLRHPGIKEVAVVGRQHGSGETRLVAAVVPAGASAVNAHELRRFLKDRLPDYMLPSAYMLVERLPLAPNGKVDRRALPSPEWSILTRTSNYVAPRTELEQLIVTIWEESLELENVGVHDDFFDLGGDSLVFGRIVSKVQTLCKVDVPLADFFEHPTVATLAGIIEKVLRGGDGLIKPITSVPRAKSSSLSFAQERLWFLHQLEPGTGAYNIPTATLIEGCLDVKAMEQALNDVIERHESLRTTFGVLNEQPVQVILPELHLSLPIIDLSDLNVAEADAMLHQVVVEKSQQPFDLTKAPLFRVLLLKLGQDRHVFVTVHHLIGDAWSIGILFRDLSTFYKMKTTGRSLPLSALPIQYADFAIWQRQRLQEEGMAAQISYWKHQLGENLTPFERFFDRPRPARQNFKGARQPVSIPVSLTAAIKELSRSESATPFMMLLAAFKALLFRYTGHKEVIVGSPVAGRTRSEVENVIGPFVNTLVLRTDFSGNPSFREILSRERQVCIEAYVHQDLPFEKLVEELQPERDLSRNPLFQIMFILQNSGGSVLDFKGLKATRLEVDGGTAKFDLTLSLSEQDKKLVGSFEFSTDLFNRDTIERMAGHYQTLLAGIVADPSQSIATLPMLSETERDQILVECNDTATEYPEDFCIHELFEAQVERTPDAVAVEFKGKQMSYGELNGRANQLAHYLITLGVGPEKLVGICVERSVEMIVGLLGILKAGGAYVPLDPHYPTKRLQFMLADSQASIILTQDSLVRSILLDISSLAKGATPKIICLDSDWDTIAQQGGENLSNLNGSTNLAYVIYTSGSTGQPKGIEIEHRSVINCLHSVGHLSEVIKSDALLAVTTISFDIAALELYLPLMVGGKIVLASREETLDGRLLLKRLRDSAATVMQATPSTWRLLLEAGWEGPSDLKILCGGEVLSRQLADQLLARGAAVWNCYGPTETTIWSTVYQILSNESQVPIGRPIANTEIYILDAYQQLVPIAVPGELHIGGAGVARGYLNQSELTAEKFIANPFSDETNSRLYRTGDIARYSAHGFIEFLGRDDNQVKIRGHRIELGEIEFALNQHPSVKESVVLACKGEAGSEKELIGYMVPRDSSTLSLTELRIFLGKKLPEYMVPSIFIFIAALPLTPNGKVDRNALPPPDGARPQIDQVFVEPRSEIEELVAQVWRELLKLNKIGVHDNFFELGGHSLLATRVVARLRNNFNVDLPLRKLFELPTVATLAEHIDHMRRHQSGVGIRPMVPVARDRPIPLSFAQRRLWFFHKLDSETSAYNIPATFRIEGPLSNVALEKALCEIVNRHEAWRTRIVESDGEPFQQIASCVTLTLPVIDVSHLPEREIEAEVNRLSAEDARRAFNLEEAPLMRSKLLRLKQDEYVLILNFHHIVCDGSSLAIFYKELATVYQALLDDKPFVLPSFRVQYADYAVWQQEGLKESLEPQLAYWKRQLGTRSTAANLLTDHNRPAMQTYNGARVTRLLTAELTTALKELSRKEGVTLFMTLLGSLDIVLSRHTGNEDIVVGSTIAGRNRPEIDGLIGFFINALAMRVDLSGNPTFQDLLKRVREVCLDAYTHQDLPFDRVVEEINPERDLSRNPLFQIMFNMADVSQRILTLPGCTVTKVSAVEPSAKFDIVLHAPEINGSVELAMVYNADLFEESTITVLVDELSWLLSQVAEKPNSNIHEYSLLTPLARAILSNAAEPLDNTWQGAIHTHLTKHADDVSEQLSVIDADERWTYSELDSQSSQLANYLIESGIQPKDMVAIYAHRSGTLVLSLLGILKAGAAFTIIDPAYPAPRLLQYLRIAQPKGWIQMAAAGELPDALDTFFDGAHFRCRMRLPTGKQVVGEFLAKYSKNVNVAIAVSADDPAYVAFTSGSTGEPKGVLGRHGPITHFLPWQNETFDLRETDRFCLLSGLAYNHLHRDIFTALYLRAMLYVPPAEILREPKQLTDWLRVNGISVLHLTPPLGQLLLTAAAEPLAAVRRVFFGGDVLTRAEVAGIRELVPNAAIGGFYGATETQRAVGYYEIPLDFDANDNESDRPIPLGRGIKDVQLLLLNNSRQLAGVGELAELYVRSPHLAAGYVGDENLTSEKFVANPFTNDPYDRLYRTGELGRYLPDGNVEWAGRTDRRVNIRGFRVELEEIESVLKQHPAVKDAAVVMQDYRIASAENAKSETRNPEPAQCLVAYIAAEEVTPDTAELLQGYLSTRLPDYMVAAHFVILEQLPLTPNGKIDYQALSAVTPLQPLSLSAPVVPRNEVEAKLSNIFCQVLALKEVGIEENFFRVGGHSLLAAQAAARIRDALGVRLELRTFLESPTVAALAKEIQHRLKAGETTPGAEDTEREEISL